MALRTLLILQHFVYLDDDIFVNRAKLAPSSSRLASALHQQVQLFFWFPCPLRLL